MKKTTLLLAYLLAILPSFANTENSPEFKIDRLGFEESNLTIPPSFVTGSRSGIAVTAEKIFMTDDQGRTAIYDRNSFTNGFRASTGLTALCSDFLSGKAYVLLNANGNQVGSGGTIVRLAEVSSGGDILANSIQLSSPINISGYSGIFSGYGRIAIYTGGRVFDVELRSGQVRDLGAKNIPLNRPSSIFWAAWGIAEFFNDSLHLVYIRDRGDIVRMKISDESVESIWNQSFLSSVNSFSVWPDAGKWYFYLPNYYYNYSNITRIGSPTADFSYSRVLLKSAQMRSGTTLMDIVFRVVDYVNPTAKVRALAFKDGVRSFSNIIRPTTFVEGTASKIGNEVPTNQDHTLTWDVAADWNVDLGQLKFEVLALDSKGLLPFNGITIPAANGKPELKINQVGISDSHVLNGLLWMYADGHSDMAISNGNLVGSASSGVFKDKVVVQGSDISKIYAHQFLFKLMNISAAGSDILNYAETATRTTNFPRNKWLTTSWPYEGSQFVYTWGQHGPQGNSVPEGLVDITQISVGENHCLALNKDGMVAAWAPSSTSSMNQPPTNIPDGLRDVVLIASGWTHCLALTKSGSVVGWGDQGNTSFWDLANVTDVKNISAGYRNSFLVKKDGRASAIGYNAYNQKNIPSQGSKIISSAAAEYSTLFLLDDGKISYSGETSGNLRYYIPSHLNDLIAIAAGRDHGVALRANGTVVTFGNPSSSLAVKNAPQNLTGVISIAAGFDHCLALKSDGSVVAWGSNSHGQCNVPADLKNAVGIAAGGNTSAAFTAKAP
jgi:alpha-tubulin suppressor-like RCC1 family protein